MSAAREEQAVVDRAYALLDAQRVALRERLARLGAAPGTGTGQDRLERQAHLDQVARQLAAVRAAEERLAFGRIDGLDGTARHIGRIGLRDEDGEPVILDWRAPNAAPFYQATFAEPMGVRRRRRLLLRDRAVTHVEDEDLTDPSSIGTAAAASAVEAPRSGRMQDIIATIAADQDAIVRSPLGQVTVVQGGPGTGKTVVALHRAAWLLYTFRDRLEKDGVLVVGPSPVFLHYIDQVLPSLGETDVVLLTPGQLYPGISARAVDDDAVAAVKGDLRMARVIANAVALRIRVPDRDVTIELEDRSQVRITAAQLREARSAVPRRSSFHAGREPFLKRCLDHLARNRARERGWDERDADLREEIVADLATERSVRRVLNLMWLPTPPERLVRILLSDRTFLADAAAGILEPREQEALLRDPGAAWTIDDVPLLDEAAELLGPWEPPSARRVDGSAGELSLAGFGVFEDEGPTTTVAERALEDRTWIYGHVVVDEAQELSRMAWRALERRASRRSMTVVGDLQQATHPAGARSWQEALAFAEDRLHVSTLRVTYRITRQTAAAATGLLLAAGGQAPDLHPVRDGEPVAEHEADEAGLAVAVQTIALAAAGEGVGRTAVVVPDDRVATLVPRLIEHSAFGAGDDALDATVSVITARESKGLEFDHVILADPDGIAGQGRRGSDVYVAATRATQRLHLIRVRPAIRE